MPKIEIEFLSKSETETAKLENNYLENHLSGGWHLFSVAGGLDPINLEDIVRVYYWIHKPEVPRMYMRVTHIVLMPGEELSILTREYTRGRELIGLIREGLYVTHYFKTADQQLLGVY